MSISDYTNKLDFFGFIPEKNDNEETFIGRSEILMYFENERSKEKTITVSLENKMRRFNIIKEKDKTEAATIAFQAYGYWPKYFVAAEGNNLRHKKRKVVGLSLPFPGPGFRIPIILVDKTLEKKSIVLAHEMVHTVRQAVPQNFGELSSLKEEAIAYSSWVFSSLYDAIFNYMLTTLDELKKNTISDLKKGNGLEEKIKELNSKKGMDAVYAIFEIYHKQGFEDEVARTYIYDEIVNSSRNEKHLKGMEHFIDMLIKFEKKISSIYSRNGRAILGRLTTNEISQMNRIIDNKSKYTKWLNTQKSLRWRIIKEKYMC